MNRPACIAAVTVALGLASAGVIAEDARFGPADPVVKDSSQLDPKRPIEKELQASVPDGFSAVAVGDLIISRPLSQHAQRLPAFGAVLEVLRGKDVTFGNLETTIFDPRTFAGAPYSWDGDWTNASMPEVAADLKVMGFDIVGRANNHSQDWGLEGMRETARWLGEAGIPHAGAGESHRMARAPAYFESPQGRIAVVSFASTFRPTSESMPPAATAPGRPGLSALHVSTTTQVPRNVVEAFAKVQCSLYGTRCKEVPREGQLFGTAFRQADLFSYEHAMDPGDLAEIYAAIRSAQLNADFVIAAIHAHECSTGCDDDNGPRGAANFLKELARGAIDSGADMFVATGNHNLGPIESSIRLHAASGRSSTGSEISSGAMCRKCCRLTFSRGTAAAGNRVEEPGEGDRIRPDGAAEPAVLCPRVHIPERHCRSPIPGQPAVGNRATPGGLGYGDRLTTSGIPRLVADESAARKFLDQIVKQTDQFGLPALRISYSGMRGVIAAER